MVGVVFGGCLEGLDVIERMIRGAYENVISTVIWRWYIDFVVGIIFVYLDMGLYGRYSISWLFRGIGS